MYFFFKKKNYKKQFLRNFQMSAENDALSLATSKGCKSDAVDNSCSDMEEGKEAAKCFSVQD